MAQTCGLVLLVLVPVSAVFALLSRVRFFTNSSGNLDAEWEDVGLGAKRYELYPSQTPTRIARARTLTPKQLFVRGIRDPMLDLEPWEALVLAALFGACFLLYLRCCCTAPRPKLKAT
ncbi:Hypothetical Protein FCC1311_002622 [Hondaea fermentalgiana]|uniref:Uncharacterized protein n=1 Tax=Hondaea fermentalgiana TaxID=2315210 RepID=A0A2R5G8Q5_9STRA|nr:Hypothetical Protein FCC1311_002622 [Hondaea fermentalgiana]|eukprot:GBG24044.1 Hypothetical Protein FCC1311_002622 [Hondaea fermentalgiana]